MGVIHQDIKPANILVSETIAVKICDLSIARVRTMHTQSIKTTRIKSIEGTPVCMTSECILRENKTSAASDMWSYGCTLVEMLTAKEIWNLTSGNEDGENVTRSYEEKNRPSWISEYRNRYWRSSENVSSMK